MCQLIYYCLLPYFPTNTGASVGSSIAFSCHDSLASFNLETFSQSFVFFDII